METVIRWLQKHRIANIMIINAVWWTVLIGWVYRESFWPALFCSLNWNELKINTMIKMKSLKLGKVVIWNSGVLTKIPLVVFCKGLFFHDNTATKFSSFKWWHVGSLSNNDIVSSGQLRQAGNESKEKSHSYHALLTSRRFRVLRVPRVCRSSLENVFCELRNWFGLWTFSLPFPTLQKRKIKRLFTPLYSRCISLRPAQRVCKSVRFTLHRRFQKLKQRTTRDLRPPQCHMSGILLIKIPQDLS